jgi:hypothetical protein
LADEEAARIAAAAITLRVFINTYLVGCMIIYLAERVERRLYGND